MQTTKQDDLPTINLDRLAVAVRVRRGDASLQNAADRTGLSTATLSKIERKLVENVDLTTLLRLAKWIGQPLEYFLDDSRAALAS